MIELRLTGKLEVGYLSYNGKIVVPEDMNENVEDVDPHQYIEDQADLDDRAESDRQARGRFLVSLTVR